MRDEDLIPQYPVDLISYFLELRGIRHHLVIDTRHALDKIGDGLARVDQRLIFFNGRSAIEYPDRYFGDATCRRITTRGLYIYDRVQDVGC